jgi:hypothetical protein
LPLEKIPVNPHRLDAARIIRLGAVDTATNSIMQGHQRRPEIHRQQFPLRRGLYFSVSAFRISAFGFDCKPRLCLLGLHQFAVVFENHLR